MDEVLAIEPWSKAIGLRQPQPGLMRHSDRGQCAFKRCRAILQCALIRQSISAADNCYDNAFVESCSGTVSTAHPLEDDATEDEAIRKLGACINGYNVERLHSLLGHVTSFEFETQSINH